MHEVGPRLWILFRAQLEEPLVRREVVAHVLEAGAGSRVAGRVEPRALGRVEVLAQEVLVEGLDVRIHAPALAVDHDPHEIRPRRRNVVARDHAVEDRFQERRIFIRVEQVQRVIAVQFLIAVHEFEVDTQRMLAALGHHAERRVAAEMHANITIRLVVDDDGGGNVHVGVIEVGELVFPVALLELQEDRAQRARVVQRQHSGTRERRLASDAGRGLQALGGRHLRSHAGPVESVPPELRYSRAALRSAALRRPSPSLSNCLTSWRSPWPPKPKPPGNP